MNTPILPDFKSLGFSDAQVRDLNAISEKPCGIKVIAGIVAAGKISTARALMHQVLNASADTDSRPVRGIALMEDRLRFDIPGAHQFQFSHDQGGFDRTARIAMKCDPDIVFIEELQKGDQGALISQMVESGISVIMPLNAGSLTDIPKRLELFRFENFEQDHYFAGAVYQTLVAKLCTSCSTPMGESHLSADYQAAMDRLKSATQQAELPTVRIRNHDGCEHCHNGIEAMTVLAEVLNITPEIKDAFVTGDVIAVRTYMKNNAIPTLHQHAIEKIMSGEVDPIDAESRIGFLDGEAGTMRFDVKTLT